jgi:radical SAM superfamily enzyme YgiQ (UPF0313 family)
VGRKRAPVCLVRPPATESFRFSSTSISLPLGLAYIAGAIETSGREVRVVDAVAEAPTTMSRYIKGYLVGLPLAEVVSRIPDDVDIVGITVIFTHEWPALVYMIDLLKAARPDLIVVLGGEHVTPMPEFCLATSKADYLVLGEGEETIVELLDALEEGRSVADMPGIAWRGSDGSAVVNPRRQRRKDVDAIPWPGWHHFDIETYKKHHFCGGLDVDAVTMPILATRGCPYQCTYCSSANMWTPKWIARDPIGVVDEIELYVNRYGARNFPFQDLTAILNRRWIIEFCEELLRRKLDIVWQLPTGTRAEAIDAEVAQLLRRSGVVIATYAPESGSEETRKLIKKRMQTDSLMASIEASIAADLNVTTVFVIGFPHDTPALIAENLPFMRRVAGMGVSDAPVFYYMALPGTEIFASLYDAVKIRIDRDYFSHILHGLAAWPAVSFNDEMSRLALFWWKVRMTYTFYSAKRRAGPKGGMLASVYRALSGLVSRKHESRLQTAFRTGVLNAWNTLRVQFSPGWMSLEEERRLFEGWDETYRAIRQKLQAEGILRLAPADTRELHENNVIQFLRKDHDVGRVLSLPNSPS